MLISHRGNIYGPKPELENRPEYIEAAIKAGFDVEVDVWLIDDELYLGHDEAQYLVGLDFFKKYMNKLWIHAKNIEALHFFASQINEDYHFFWHQNDDFTLTSYGFIWTFPGKFLTDMSIVVKPSNVNTKGVAGVCSDFIGNAK